MSDIPVLTTEVDAAPAQRQRPLGRASYVAGSTDEPLRFVPLGTLLEEAAAAHGSRAAAVFHAERQVLSWNDLQRQADLVAGSMLALGMQRGDTVGILAPTCAEWLPVLFGTARIGAALVNLPSVTRAPELEAALNRSRCRMLFIARTVDDADPFAMLRGLAPEIDRPAAKPVLEARRLPHLKHVLVLAEGLVPACAQRYSDFVRNSPPSAKRKLSTLARTIDPDDAANVQFTSGTTGAPRPATLTHFGLVNNATAAAAAMGLTEADKVCITVPLSTGLGLVCGVLASVAAGATMVFPGARHDPQQTLDAVSRHRCTAMHGTPALFAGLLAHPERATYDTSCLRTGILTGAAGHGELVPRLVEEMQMDELVAAYGLAEGGPLVFQTQADDPLDVRIDTVGRVLPHMEVKVIGAEGQIVPVGVVGELCCRGHAVMRGYWEDAKRTREVLDAAGWLHTGDLASIDADGCCRIHGRAGDAIVRGGRTVMAGELEAAIAELPGVREVRVFGVADAELGEEVCACIVLEDGASLRTEAILAHCRKRAGAGRAPRHVRVLGALPRTASGSVKTYLLRSAMTRELDAARARAG